MAGYSQTPLLKKLGVRPGCKAWVKNPPDGYFDWLGPLPEGAVFLSRPGAAMDFLHVFLRNRSDLKSGLKGWMATIQPAGMLWVSWPKKASKVATDITEDAVRAEALPLGLVDVKVCAVDEVWSGLKLVIRKEKKRA